MIHYSNNCGKAILTYMDIYTNRKCYAECIVSAFRPIFAHNKFDVKNLVGIGNKNASVMVG